jgi:alkylhydroperoxidase family enzyme
MTEPLEARVPLLPPEEWDPDLLALVERAVPRDGPPLQFFEALAHNPKLTERWLRFAAQILGRNSLPARERELLVLRTVWNCKATYEWVHHAEIGEENGLSPAEIQAIKAGPDAPNWTADEATLLRAADELHAESVISQATWDALAARFDPSKLLEVVMLVGEYTLVAFYVRSFAIPLEHDVVPHAHEVGVPDDSVVPRVD